MLSAKVSSAIDVRFDSAGNLEPLVPKRGLHEVATPPSQTDDCSVEHRETSHQVAWRRITAITVTLVAVRAFQRNGRTQQAGLMEGYRRIQTLSLCFFQYQFGIFQKNRL